MTDDLLDIRDFLLAEEERLDERLRACKDREVIGQPGLPFAAPQVADFLFGGWTRFFDNAPTLGDKRTPGGGLGPDLIRKGS